MSKYKSLKKYSVIDTCSIWNLISSKILYQTILSEGFYFCITNFVLYECIFKPRKKIDEKQIELINRFKKEREKKRFQDYTISIEDLQSADVLANSKRQSKGELTSIIFASKTRQAFITDDQGARKLAAKLLDPADIQTSPILLGHLVYSGKIMDSQVDEIIKEHNELEGSVSEYFKKAFYESLEEKLAETS